MNTFVVNGKKKRACSGTSARRRFPGRINHSNQKSIPISDERPRLQPEREMKHVFFFFLFIPREQQTSFLGTWREFFGRLAKSQSLKSQHVPNPINTREEKYSRKGELKREKQ